ncbi:hypothetical protein FB446DRAFT_655726 [Lentinula raphanica]|nr:hypothetical protein FB446DRAFT_655726 [Lentinula raphanica]
MHNSLQDLYGTDLDDIDSLFNFLPDEDDLPTSVPKSSLDPPPPQPLHRSLVEDEDNTWIWHPTAGKVVKMDRNVEKRWLGIKSGKDEADSMGCYSPFSSRLEWEVTQWAVKEKVSQGSVNRLLQIPQVKEKLGLTFNNAKSMLDKLESIPEHCGPWMTKKLSFKDRPGEEFLIYHRDPIEAVKALWGDPALAGDLVYKPAKLFRNSDQSEDNRIFSEMWTASFWNAAQASAFYHGKKEPYLS